MPVVRRNEQPQEDVFPGIARRSMTWPGAGAKMLSVSDLIMQPGSEIPYHVHSNTEETIFLVEGALECILDDHRVALGPGDGVIASAGTGHGFANRSSQPARVITMYPTIAPERRFVEPGPPAKGPLPRGVSLRANLVPTEPWDGVRRYDVVSEAQGAESTLFSEIIFSPGASSPVHYHPETEESMFTLRGTAAAVYGKDELQLAAGDMFMAEPGVRHGTANRSDSEATLLAIHPTTSPVRVPVD